MGRETGVWDHQGGRHGEHRHSGDRYRGILGIADDPVISADIIGGPRASVVDAGMTRVVDGTLIKVMSWYGNEWGFACEMIREAFASLGLIAASLGQVRP